MDAPVSSAETAVATVRKYIDDFNRGDAKAMASRFTNPAFVLDGMAPHVWYGPKAGADWYKDVLIEGRHAGATDYSVILGEPLHANVTGDAAYVVVPASMTFNLRDKQITQTGAVFTVALSKCSDGWRIAAWAWAKGAAR